MSRSTGPSGIDLNQTKSHRAPRLRVAGGDLRSLRRHPRRHHRCGRSGPHPVIRGEQLRQRRHRRQPDRLWLHPAVRPRPGRHIQLRSKQLFAEHRLQKHYTWDPLLDFVAPPSYLAPSTPPWTLGSVTTNPGADSASVCPPLLGVYSGLVGGVAQTGPAVTQYCSGSPGGLPNYPSSTVPSPPTGVSASQTNGTVTVNWTDPPITADPPSPTTP